jgi:hypothetical protein
MTDIAKSTIAIAIMVLFASIIYSGSAPNWYLL